MNTDKPKRRFEVEIQVSGDTWEDVARELRHLLPHLEDHGPACDQVSGGYSSGSWVQVVERPEVTHESFSEQLDVYLTAKKAEGT